MKPRLWLRYLRRRRWYRYLRVTGIRAWAEVGPKRAIFALLAAVAGGVLNVDLGFAVTALSGFLFLIYWLVLVPAEMWDEAKPTTSVESDAKTVVHVHPGATYVGSQVITSEGVSGTAGVANRSAPRSPRKSKRDPQPPPPSLGL